MITSTKAVSLRGMQQCMIRYWEVQIRDANIKSQGDKQQESLKKVGNQYTSTQHCRQYSDFQAIIQICTFLPTSEASLMAGILLCLGEGFSRIQKHSTKTRIVLSKPKQLVTLPPILSYCILVESSGINYLLSVLQCLYL